MTCNKTRQRDNRSRQAWAIDECLPAGAGSYCSKDSDVKNMAAALKNDDAVAYNNAYDSARQPWQTRVAGIRQCTLFPGQSRRQGPAAGQLLLYPGRQVFEIVPGEASVQDLAVAIAEVVSIITPGGVSVMFIVTIMVMVVVIVVIIVVMS